MPTASQNPYSAIERSQGSPRALVVDGYVRVSQVGGRSGERFISPSVQRDQIETWVAARGYMIGEVFEELDESGGRADRPLLEEAVGRIERGDSHGIVVAKIDRFGRSLIHGLAAIERVTRAGGMFVSVQDGLDLSTDTGRLVLRLMLSMGEWELDRVRANWDTACARAIARGVYVGGAPFGYRRRQSGRLAVEPSQGPVVAELFRRRANGASAVELRDHLLQHQVSSPRGATNWNNRSILGLLANRTYLGEVRRGEYVRAGAHEALTEPATWAAAQRPVQHLPMRDRTDEPALLRGILRCAGCRRLMTTNLTKVGPGRSQRYGCRLDPPTPCGVCAAIRDTVIEPYVEALFWQELPKLQRRQPRRLAALQAEVKRHESDLARYRDNPRIISTLGLERYEQGLAVRVGRAERALVALAQARRRGETEGLPRPEELRASWPQLSTVERRGLLREVFDCIFVMRRKPGPIEGRLHACLRGQAPPDLPQPRPRLTAPAQAVDLEELGRSPTLSTRSQRRWPERELRARLHPFLAGRERWPDYPQFQRAGLALVYRQVKLHGGPRRWATEFGLTYTTQNLPLRQWSEQRVRRELEDFLADRDGWPTAREFRQSGREALRRAVVRSGGREYWAREFGRELTWRQRDTAGYWTDERIEAALSALSEGSTRFPTRRQIADGEYPGLFRAIGPAESRQRWAQRLGLTLHPRAQAARHWTTQRIERSLRPLLRDRRVYPTRTEFAQAGMNGLYQAIDSTPQGHAYWADQFGLLRARPEISSVLIHLGAASAHQPQPSS